MSTKSHRAVPGTVLLAALFATTLGCREPTEAVIDITTDGVCSDVGGTGISVGPLETVETKDYDTTTSVCEGSGNIGSLVLLPPEDGEKDAPFAFKVVTSLDGPAEDCVPPAYGRQCIVARRSMRFSPHHAFHVPVRMRQACAGVLCPEKQSCVDGTCRSATVDPEDCDGTKACEPLPGVVAPWEKQLGGFGRQMARQLTLAADGTLAVTGNFEKKIDLGGGALTSKGGDDVYLATYSPEGLFRWATSFGGGGFDEGLAVAIDAHSDIYVAAHFEGTVDFGGGPLTSAGLGDIALVKVSSFGKPRWAQRFGGVKSDVPAKIAVDADRNVYLTGTFSGSADFGGAKLTAAGPFDATDVFIASFTPAGDLRWAKALGGPGNDDGAGVGVDAKGNVYVGGGIEDQANIGGPAPVKIVGTADAFITSFDTNGGFRWAKSFGSNARDLIIGLAVRDDRVVATGVLGNDVTIDGTLVPAGSLDGFVASFDTGGKLAWAKAFGGSSNRGEAVDIAEDGSVVVGGEIGVGSVFGSPPVMAPGSLNPFVAVLERDGTPRWARSYPSSMAASITGVGAPADGFAYVAGWVTGTLTSDGKTITSNDAEDVLLWRVGPP